MYHAHDFGSIAVLNGLFAVFQIGDMALPAGETIGGVTLPTNLKVTQELPIVLNDAGVIGLSLNGKSYTATAPISAAPGDVLLVHYCNEGLMIHPMHLHHVAQLVIAKDGFPLDHPYWRDHHRPGERYKCWDADQGRHGCVGLALPHPQPRRKTTPPVRITALVVATK